MYYKIQTNGYPTERDFNLGFGFYMVHNKEQNLTDIHYYNPKNNWWSIMQPISDMPSDFLKLFEEDVVEKDVVEETIQKEGYVSESFALKAMALAKANTNTIKVSDILNNE